MMRSISDIIATFANDFSSDNMKNRSDMTIDKGTNEEVMARKKKTRKLTMEKHITRIATSAW